MMVHRYIGLARGRSEVIVELVRYSSKSSFNFIESKTILINSQVVQATSCAGNLENLEYLETLET
jgi:hypothetical protein